MKKRRRDDERTKKEHRILENYDTAARHKRTNTSSHKPDACNNN